MVLSVRSSTDDNLRARANCGTGQVPAIEAASVGFSIAFLSRYGWSYSKKVAYYAQHLICTDAIYTIPAEESRAPGSLSLNVEHSFTSDEESRKEYFTSKNSTPSSSSSAGSSCPDAFGRQFEVIHGGSAFLRAVEDVWDMGEQILSSLSVRILDLDQNDMDSTDIFFAFFDLFILAYYNGTKSSCCDARRAVVENMGKFYDIRQRLRARTGSGDMVALVEELLAAAETVRDGIMGIAHFEARKDDVVMRERSPMWENGISGKAALLMLARGMSIDEDDDETIFRDLVNGNGERDIPNLAQVLARCNNIRRLADTFSRSEEEYLDLFSTPDEPNDESCINNN